MNDCYRIALAQLNPVVGDLAGNLKLARQARARASGADVILFSELFIVGYSPEDLVLKPALQKDARAAVEELARDTDDGGPAILIGTPWVDQARLYNAVALLDRGKVESLTYKYELPNYGVFDEKRVLRKAASQSPSVRAASSWAFPSARISGSRMSPSGWPMRELRFSACPMARRLRPARKMCG